MVNEDKSQLWYIQDSVVSFDEEGGYAFMSNFYPSGIVLYTEFGFQEFPTVEHAYQWHKPTMLSQRAAIQEAETPGKAKRFGQQCDLVQDWEQIKVGVMRSCLFAKFSNSYLYKLLKNTKMLDLIEGNTWNDTFWGATKRNDRFYQGANVLGQLLMNIRNVS